MSLHNPFGKIALASGIRSMIAGGSIVKTPKIKGGTIALSGANHQLTVTHK
jgi:hypothetical protein